MAETTTITKRIKKIKQYLDGAWQEYEIYGSGGGGASDATTKVSMSNLTGWNSTTIANTQATCIISLTWSSTFVDSDESTGGGIVSVFYGSNLMTPVFTKKVEQGAFDIDLKPYLQGSTNTFKVQVTDSQGQTTSRNFTVNTIDFTLSSVFQWQVPWKKADTLTISCNVSGVGYYRRLKVSVNEQAPVILDLSTTTDIAEIKLNATSWIPGQSYFISIIGYAATSKLELETTTLTSNLLSFDIPVYDDTSYGQPIVSINIPNDFEVQQYKSSVLPYSMCIPIEDNATGSAAVSGTIQIEKQNVETSNWEIVQESSVAFTATDNVTASNYSFVTDQVGRYRFTVSAIAADVTITESREFVVIAFGDDSIDLSAAEKGQLWSPMGRSNQEVNPAHWEDSRGVSTETAVFYNFNWTNDGWLLDADDQPILKLRKGRYVDIPCNNIFYAGSAGRVGTVGDNGFTIEVAFAARDVENYSVPLVRYNTSQIVDGVITNPTDESGLVITGENVWLSKTTQADSLVSLPYKDEVMVRASIIVNRLQHKSGEYAWFANLYINGIFSRSTLLQPKEESSIKPYGFPFQDSMHLILGSDYATLDIYSIRIITSEGLISADVVKNWIADIPVFEQKWDAYTRNNILTVERNALDFDKMVIGLPTTPYMIINSKYAGLPQVGDKIKIGVAKYIDPVNADNNFWVTNAQWRIQGTSSAGYPRKNYRLYLNKEDETQFCQNGVVTTSGNSFYKLRANSVPADVFTFKADMASSEGANNVELIRLYDDLSKACGILTPAQHQDLNMRYGIDGFPMLIFCLNDNAVNGLVWDEEAQDYVFDAADLMFIGKYNFNNDKSTPDVYGLGEYDESWEFRDNIYDEVRYLTDEPRLANWSVAFENRHYGDSLEPPFDEDNDVYPQSPAMARFRDMYDWVVSTNTMAVSSTSTGVAVNKATITTTDDFDSNYKYYVKYTLNNSNEFDQNKIYYTRDNSKVNFFDDVTGSKMGPYYTQDETTLEYTEVSQDAKLQRGITYWYGSGKNLSLLFETGVEYYYYALTEVENPSVLTDLNWQFYKSVSTAAEIDAGTYVADNFSYRRNKFKTEVGQYFNVDALLFNYLFTEFFLMIDNRAKNTFPSYYATREESEMVDSNGNIIANTYADGGNRWYILPYDYDTALGINNQGQLSFTYDLESIDQVKEGDSYSDVFNGQDSVLFRNVASCFATELETLYQRMRGAQLNATTIFTYEEVASRFTNHQSLWGEAIFNLDAQVKYIDSYFEENKSYLYMLQGAKEEQRSQWLFNRFYYMDSKYRLLGNNFFQLTAEAGGTLTLTPNKAFYLTAGWGRLGEVKVYQRQKAQIPYTANIVSPGGAQFYWFIGFPKFLNTFGDLSTFQNYNGAFAESPKVTELILSTAAVPNKKVWEGDTLNFNLFPLLEKLDCTNWTHYNKNISLASCYNIKEVYTSGTSVPIVTVPDSSVIEKLTLPNTLTDLVLIDQTFLTDFSIDAPVNGQYTALRYMKIVNPTDPLGNKIWDILQKSVNNTTFVAELTIPSWPVIATSDQFIDFMSMDPTTDCSFIDQSSLTNLTIEEYLNQEDISYSTVGSKVLLDGGIRLVTTTGATQLLTGELANLLKNNSTVKMLSVSSNIEAEPNAAKVYYYMKSTNKIHKTAAVAQSSAVPREQISGLTPSSEYFGYGWSDDNWKIKTEDGTYITYNEELHRGETGTETVKLYCDYSGAPLVLLGGVKPTTAASPQSRWCQLDDPNIPPFIGTEENTTIALVDGMEESTDVARYRITLPRTVTSFEGYGLARVPWLKEVAWAEPNGETDAQLITFGQYGCTATPLTVFEFPAFKSFTHSPYNPNTKKLEWGITVGNDFFRSSSLTSLTIPVTVIEYGGQTIMDNPHIKEVIIEDSAEIGGETYYKQSILANLPAHANGEPAAHPKHIYKEIKDEQGTILGYMLQEWCGGYLPSENFDSEDTYNGYFNLTLDSQVIELGTYCFYSRYAYRHQNKNIYINNLNVPNVQKIRSNACSSFYRLKAFTASDHLIEISDGSFASCSGLTTLNLYNVQNINLTNAFKSCSNLKNITFNTPESITAIGSSTFEGCSKLVDNSDTDNAWMTTLETIGKLGFSKCRSLINMNLPNLITVNNMAFSDCSALETLILSKPVTWGTDVFTNCVALKDNSEGDNEWLEDITAIPTNMFIGCTGLTKLALNATTVNAGAFSDCSNLKTVEFWTPLESIASGAFTNCSSEGLAIWLKYEHTNDTKIEGIITETSFPANTTIYVPEAYEWKYTGVWRANYNIATY